MVAAHGVRPPTGVASDELVYLCRGDRGGNPDEVKRLLSRGADVNHRDHKGKAALHRASKAGFLKTMTVLLDHGALVESEDFKGETPLFDAVRSTIKDKGKKHQAIQLLLQAGASPQHRNTRGITPLTVAEKLTGSESQALVRLLECQSK